MLLTVANSPLAVPRCPHDFTKVPSFVNFAIRELPSPSATKMLPCASHATSVGRLKTSCGAPAPAARPPPRPPPSAPGPGPPARVGGLVVGFGFPPRRQKTPAPGSEIIPHPHR